MATFAIGDVQGCFQTLKRLLARCDFDPFRDRAWLAGDLVNRGPDSLGVLRWAHAHADSVVAVLGNHDLHLLARAAGAQSAKRLDTLDDVLAAPDRDVLLDWLRACPLLHREDKNVMVHAGLLPAWTLDEAERAAKAVSTALAGEQWRERIAGFWGKTEAPRSLPDKVLRESAQILTCLRMVDRAGRPDPRYNGPPEDAPAGLVPWFDARRRHEGARVIFAHWAALGLLVRDDVIGLDTGCVWRRELTAVRLDDRQVFQEPYADGPSVTW